MKSLRTIFIAISLLILISSIYGAPTPHGTTLARAKNVHSGNKIRTTFYNYGLVGRWSDQPDDIGGEWPINSTHEYIGDVSILVGAEIIDNEGHLQHSVVTTFSPRGSELSGDTHYGWEPLAGYTNNDTNLVAMSHMGPPVNPSDETHVNTWPDQWLDKLEDDLDPGWSGKWNGYFGKGQLNAEQESYFIMDDANDAEFEFYPDTTDFARRGLGLNATVRGLQWNHILAEDVLFWLYDIKNIGNKNHNKIAFGAIVGTITGGDGDTQDDYADFDKMDDVAYSWDHGTDLETGLGGIGSGGWTPVGLAGYAFLESPGNSIDGIDNDGDGTDGSGDIITEEMFEPVTYAPGDSVVVIDYDNYYIRSVISMPEDYLIIPYSGYQIIFYPNTPLEEIPRNLIDDNLNGLIDENNGASIELVTGAFEDVYLNVGLKYIDYLTGLGADNPMIDESRSDGIDNDGDWDPESDDVGRDGAPGSGDTFYGEGDGVPTSGYEYVSEEWVDTGLPGEPNIDKTDIDESDQIGLSSFYYFTFGTGPGMSDDRRLWSSLDPGYFNKSVQNADADFLFGSGYFPLLTEETERFSLALLFGDNLPDLIRNKQTVQTIYNQNYNFAKAPDLPTVWAYAGDGYVTLYWDERAENSYDRITGYDFEGYKIYKATDTQWTDAGTITDAFGSAKFHKSLKQFDLINEYSDFSTTDVSGVKFYLGDNTGLVHIWTDSSVINGHRYFYAVTAYDHGEEVRNIFPAETSKFVTVDKGGNVQTAQNVVSVVPDAPSAGYVAPPKKGTVYHIRKARGTGNITLNNIDPSKIPSGHIYRIYFMDTRSNGVDDDGDWAYVDDSYANGVWDSTDVFYDYGLDGIPDTGDEGEGNGIIDWIDAGPMGNGVWDSTETFFDFGLDTIPGTNDEGENNGQIDWLDYGLDGIKNQLEPGYNPMTNPDPNHDNYYPEGNCSDGWDNDGDGDIDETDDAGECLDLGTENDGVYQIEEDGETFLDGDGLYQVDEDGEPFLDGNVRFDKDVGYDGCRDEFENGYGGCLEEENPGYIEGDDPNHDNWDPENNCSDGWDNDGDGSIDEVSTTGRCLDLGTEGNQSPDHGEPDIDYSDLEEMIPVTTHFMVIDITNSSEPDTVIPWTKDIDEDLSIFSGMQIIVENDWAIRKQQIVFLPQFDEEYSISFATFSFYGFRTEGKGYPKDIQVIFSDLLTTETDSVTIIEDNGNPKKLLPIKVNYFIVDPFDNQTIPFAVIDQTIEYTIIDSIYNPADTSYDVFTYDTTFVDPGYFSQSDRIILLQNVADTTIITWAFSPTSKDSSSALHKPGSGDTLNITLSKPFTSEDVFEFVSTAPYVDKSRTKSEIKKVKVVPNPYIAGASWEGQNPYATGRGPRSLHFNHLPPNCEIRIYTLVGELVDIITHDTPIDDGSAEWDMLTKDNLDIAYGVYIYHIAPIPGSEYDFKPVLGKFAVIK